MVKAKLLVVEDDKYLLLGLRDILELDGYEVVTAENGKEALTLLRSLDVMPDLIVSDIMMPYMDGMELLRQIRQEPRWVTIPFIFLTARGEKTDVHQGKALGVDEYLVKPFDADDLLVAVESRLKRHQEINQVQANMVSNIKRNILTMLNHEFRTPLTLVVAYADMLNEFNVNDMSQVELLDFLKGVNSGAQRLRRLVENFILLVEMENGDTMKTYEWRSQRIDDYHILLEGAVQNVGADTNKHDIVIEVEPNLPAIKGDRDYLTIALRELLSNALKFTADGKQITLSAHQNGIGVELAISDEGRGIPEEELAKIWQPFYQIKREHFEDQGSGAGLAIVDGMVRLHKGKINVKSTVGRGSKFSIVLPV